MTVAILKWATRVLVFGGLLLLTAASWLIATESGTRWLYARADRWIPDALLIEGLGGSLLSGLEAASVRWDQPGIALDARDARVTINLAAALGMHLSVESLKTGSVRIELDDSRSEQDGDPFGGFESPVPIGIDSGVINDIEIRTPGNTTRISRVEISARLHGSRLDIDQLAVTSEWLSTRISGVINLTSALPRDIEGEWSGVTLADHPFAGGVTVTGNASEIHLRHVLKSPVELSTEGTVVLGDAGWNVDLENQWTRVEWAMSPGQEIASRDGRLRITGNVADYRAEGEFWIRFADWPEARAGVSGHGDLVMFVFDRLGLESNAGRIDARGRLGWSPDVDWDASFDGNDLDTALLGTELAGTVSASGRSTGLVSGGALARATLDLERVDGEFLSLPANASGSLAYATGRLDITAGSLVLGSARATVAGHAGDDIDLEFELETPDIGEVLPEASGRVAASARIEGSPDAPILNASARGTRLAWRNYSTADMEATAEFSPGQSFAVSVDGAGLSDGARTVDRWSVSASGRPESHRVELDAGSAAGTARLAAAGGYADGAWTGQLDTIDLDGEDVGRWRVVGPTRLLASASAARLDLLCLDRQDVAGRACVEFGYSPNQPLDFAVSIADLPVAALPYAAPAGVGIAGRIFVEASGEAAADSIDASAAIEIRNASVTAEIDGAPESVHFTRLAGHAAIEANRLAAEFDVAFSEGGGIGHVELDMADVRSPDSALSGMARIQIGDLSLLELLIPALRDPSGTLQGEVSVAGRARAPSLSGKIELRDGRAGIPAAGTEIQDVRIALEQTEPGSLAISGSAVSGNGRVSIEGRTTLDPVTGLETDIRIAGDDFELLQLPDIQASASPDVNIHVDTDEVTVRGGLRIPRAGITVQSIPEGARKPSQDAVVRGRDATENGDTRRTNVDIDVTLGNEVKFAGFGLTTGLTGNLRVQAAPSAPVTGLGRISLVGGRYEAYGQDLEIERGELIFNGPINNPLLDVRAIRRLPDVTAGIHVTGTPSMLSSEVFSDPAMSDVEALSYLLTGHALATADMGEGDLMNKAAFALGMSQAGAISSQVRSSLGLETLTLQGGVDDSRIVAGKRIGGRLLVEYGYGLVDRLGTLILKYQINEQLVLESSTGSVSTLDILYKVRRK